MSRFASQQRQTSPQRRRHFFGPLRIWNWSSHLWGLVLLLLVGVIRWEVHAAASTTGQPTKHTNDNDQQNNHPQNDWLGSWLQNQHSCPTTTKLGLLPSHNNNKDKNEESGPVVVVVALEDIAVNESLVVLAVPSSDQDWMCSSSSLSSAGAVAPLFPASFFTHHELPPPRPVAANRWSRTAHAWILDHVLLSQDGLNPRHFGIVLDDDDDEEDDEEEEEGLDDDEGLDEDKEHDHTRNRDAELEETDTSSFMEDHRTNARLVTWQYHDDEDDEDEDPQKNKPNPETQSSEHPILYQLVATRDIAKGEKLICNAGDGPFVTPHQEQKEDKESHETEDPHPDSSTSTTTTTPRVQRTRRQWMVSTGYWHQPHPTRRREMDDRLVWDVHYTISNTDNDNDNNNKNNQDAMSWNETTTTTMPKRITAVQWRSYPPTLAQWNWLQSQYQRLRTDPEIRRHVVPMGVQPSGTATTPPPVDDVTGENPSSSSSLVFANPLEHYQFQYYYHSFLHALHAALVSVRSLGNHNAVARNKRVVEVTTDRDETQPVDQWLHFYHQFVADHPDNHHTRDLETCTTDDAFTTARMNFTHVRLVRRQTQEKNADDESLIHLPSLEEWYDPLEERLDDGLNYDAHKESQECDLPPSPNHPYVRVGTDGEYHHSQLQVDRVSSPYQQLEWRHFVHPPEHYNPLRTTTTNSSSPSFVARDTCLYLDDLFHSCTATRAHVHETMIHYPASFLPQGLKRVLFVGGGDLVILHEILKYPSLELVIGMELDQAVLRTSFQHYGISPHFEEYPKVQWWFGNASKSLALLPPDEYFGTFDLIVIDLLSYVFETLTVTPLSSSGDEDDERYTLIDYLMKLVHPQGILLRQEDFVHRNVVDFAKYTVDVDLSGLPYYCHQSFTLGSNGIDFLSAQTNGQRYDHGIDTFIYQPWADHSSLLWSSYRTNDLIQPSFSNAKSNNDTNLTDRTPSPLLGLLIILEVEESEAPLHDSRRIEAQIRQALRAEPLRFTEILSTSDKRKQDEPNKESSSSSSLIVVFQEGYVVGRLYPEYKYCALDVQLWNRMDQRDSVIRALTAVFQPTPLTATISAYQITTGGMSLRRGMAVPVTRNTTIPSETDTSTVKPDIELSNTDQHLVLSHILSMTLVVERDRAVLVVCPTTNCTTYENLLATQINDADQKMTFIPLWTCPELSAFENENNDDDDEAMREKSFYHRLVCERKLRTTLQEQVFWQSQGLHAIVIDPAVPRAMGQVLYRIMLHSVQWRGMSITNPNWMVVVPMPRSPATSSSWRRALLDRIRSDLVSFNPVVDAHVVVRQTHDTTSHHGASEMKVGLLSVGDEHFYKHLNQVFSSIQEANPGLVPHLALSKVGLQQHVPNFDQRKTVTDLDYNVDAGRAQWLSQKGVAQQTIWQYEWQQTSGGTIAVGTQVFVNDHVHPWDGTWFLGTVLKQPSDETTDKYHVMRKRNRGVSRHTVSRSQLLLADDTTTSFAAPLTYGEQVIVRDSDHDDNDNEPDETGEVTWVQGYIQDASRSDGLYKVRCFDSSILVVPRRDIVGRKGSSSSSSLQEDDESKGPQTPGVSCSDIEQFMDQVLESTKHNDTKETTTDTAEIGNGCLVTADFAGGHVIVTWDGRSHMDINLHAHLEHVQQESSSSSSSSTALSSSKVVEQLVAQFFPHFAMIQKDEQPRGFGRIVVQPPRAGTAQDLTWFGQFHDDDDDGR